MGACGLIVSVRSRRGCASSLLRPGKFQPAQVGGAEIDPDHYVVGVQLGGAAEYADGLVPLALQNVGTAKNRSRHLELEGANSHSGSSRSIASCGRSAQQPCAFTQRAVKFFGMIEVCHDGITIYSHYIPRYILRYLIVE